MDWDDRGYSEADVVMELVHRLKLLGENVRCEVQLPSGHHRSGFMRCDVVVIRDNKIAFAIEVKEQKRKFRKGDHHRQERAYMEIERDLGIRVIWVHGMEKIARAIGIISAESVAA